VLNRCDRASASFPGAEELRMVRAIARLALLEAARHGQYHASFHGFRVYAMRESAVAGSDVSEVSFLVSHQARSLERGVVAVYAPHRMSFACSRASAKNGSLELGTNRLERWSC